MGFLAIIGLICLFYLATKVIRFIGNCFDGLDHYIANEAIQRSVIKIKRKPNFDIKHKEKINTIKGDGTDSEYMKKVQEEIDRLTEESSE